MSAGKTKASSYFLLPKEDMPMPVAARFEYVTIQLEILFLTGLSMVVSREEYSFNLMF